MSNENKMTFDKAFGIYSAYYRDQGFGYKLEDISTTHSKATPEGGYRLKNDYEGFVAHITKEGKVEA